MEEENPTATEVRVIGRVTKAVIIFSPLLSIFHRSCASNGVESDGRALDVEGESIVVPPWYRKSWIYIFYLFVCSHEHTLPQSRSTTL